VSYTEFFVTHGSAAANTNGGGPRLGANDGPVYSTADSTVDAGTPTTITDNTGNNWSGVQADDWLAWNPSGSTWEYRRVVSNNGDGTITIHAAATAGATRPTNVGGAWATVQSAIAAVTSSFTNAAGNPPRINVKADGDYTGTVNQGNSSVKVEGYTTSPGDGGVFKLDTSTTVSALQSWYVYASNVTIKNAWIYSSGRSRNAVQIGWGGSYAYACNLINVRAEVANDNTSSNSGFAMGQAHNMTYFENCRAIAYGYGFRDLWHCVLVGCRATAIYGYHVQGDAAVPARFDSCIAESCSSYGIYVGNPQYFQSWSGRTSHAKNCVFYNCGTGYYSQYYRQMVSQSIFAGCTTNIGGSGCGNRNAFYGGSNSGYTAVGTDITLSGNPFVDAANGDFRLNSNSGAGAACRAAGFPGPLLDGTNVGYLDAGALQHQDTEGGGEHSAVWAS